MTSKWDHRQSLKEILRHAGFTLGAEPWLRKYRRKRGHVVDHLESVTSAMRFGAAFKTGAWIHAKGQRSLSGLGSELGATLNVREELPLLLERLDCRVLLDIGCGDWNWMREVHLSCDYVGIDIVPEIIEANCRYERSGVSFKLIDGAVGPLPKADVALCREVLFHFSFRDGRAMLANVRKAARWLVATTDPTIWFNSDIITGDFRKVNLQRSPYRLPPPGEIVADGAVSQGRVLGVWATKDLPV
jgi:hypothetical protein